MMPRLRSEYDADRQSSRLPMEYETATHRYEVPCSICGTKYYFDGDGKAELEVALTEAGENPFVCAGCEADYEEAAHEH